MPCTSIQCMRMGQDYIIPFNGFAHHSTVYIFVFFLEERVLYIVDDIPQKFHSKFLNPRSQWKNS